MEPEYDGPLSLREMKRNAAHAALDFVEPGSVIGVGSGTTVWCFIDLLAESGMPLAGAVATSRETARRLSEIGVKVLDLDHIVPALYVDGADRIDMSGRALKGRGAALTHEKIVAAACEYWACVVDATKATRSLGGGAIELEVDEALAESVSSAVRALGGRADRREGILTDDGNPVFEALGLSLEDPLAMEETLDAIPGIIGNGIFARRRADVILVGRAGGGVGRIVPHAPDERLS
jgi:ribose 5-phosphate isomerase A